MPAPTITVEYDGRFYVIPLEFQGQRIPPDDAFELFRTGQLKPVSSTPTPANKRS